MDMEELQLRRDNILATQINYADAHYHSPRFEELAGMLKDVDQQIYLLRQEMEKPEIQLSGVGNENEALRNCRDELLEENRRRKDFIHGAEKTWGDEAKDLAEYRFNQEGIHANQAEISEINAVMNNEKLYCIKDNDDGLPDDYRYVGETEYRQLAADRDNWRWDAIRNEDGIAKGRDIVAVCERDGITDEMRIDCYFKHLDFLKEEDKKLEEAFTPDHDDRNDYSQGRSHYNEMLGYHGLDPEQKKEAVRSSIEDVQADKEELDGIQRGIVANGLEDHDFSFEEGASTPEFKEVITQQVEAVNRETGERHLIAEREIGR